MKIDLNKNIEDPQIKKPIVWRLYIIAFIPVMVILLVLFGYKVQYKGLSITKSTTEEQKMPNTLSQVKIDSNVQKPNDTDTHKDKKQSKNSGKNVNNGTNYGNMHIGDNYH